LRKIIYDHYGIRADKIEKIGKYNTFVIQNQLHFIVPVATMTEGEVIELQQMSSYMAAKGDATIATFVPTRSGTFIATIHEQPVVILRGYIQPYARSMKTGKELAKFHQRGRTYPYPVNQCNRIGRWKELWGTRLDQMEIFWRGKVQAHPENAFEKLFIESFPYYLGLTENAIQYLVDTELDDQPLAVDCATICHQRFTDELWQQGIKFPTDWVYDHCARDLAEWVRHLYHTNQTVEANAIRSFFQEYQRVMPLTTFSWRLVYSRLLFPLHYFECIEGYYLAQKEEHKKTYENKLLHILNHSREYEKFLAEFYDLVEPSPRRNNLPKIKWLSLTRRA
jgi:spore coat protein YutH